MYHPTFSSKIPFHIVITLPILWLSYLKDSEMLSNLAKSTQPAQDLAGI